MFPTFRKKVNCLSFPLAHVQRPSPTLTVCNQSKK